MNDSPAFESRRVRTQPLTVTTLSIGTLPLTASLTFPAIWLGSGHYPRLNNSLSAFTLMTCE